MIFTSKNSNIMLVLKKKKFKLCIYKFCIEMSVTAQFITILDISLALSSGYFEVISFYKTRSKTWHFRSHIIKWIKRICYCVYMYPTIRNIREKIEAIENTLSSSRDEVLMEPILSEITEEYNKKLTLYYAQLNEIYKRY